MKFNFDEVIDRRGTYAVKWDGGELLKELGKTTRFDDDTIPLFTADMDFATAPPIIEAMRRVADHRMYGYSLVSDEYYEAICGWYARRHAWVIQKDHIVHCGGGTIGAVVAAVKAFTAPGDGIIVQLPLYPPLFGLIEKCGRKLLNNTLIPPSNLRSPSSPAPPQAPEALAEECRVVDETEQYTIDFEDFEAKASLPTTTMFILCNPHNPTGRIFRLEELRRLASICHRHNVMIVADEIHGDLIRCSETFIPIAKAAEGIDFSSISSSSSSSSAAAPTTAPNPDGVARECGDSEEVVGKAEEKEKTQLAVEDHTTTTKKQTPAIITCTSISKTFNLAGLHCTNVIIADPALRAKFVEALGTYPMMGSPFSIAAVIAAYGSPESEAWLEALKAYLDGTLAAVLSFLKARLPRVRAVVPQGTYTIWLDFSQCGLSDEAVKERIYERANVVLQNGEEFGKCEGAGFQRICLPSPRSVVMEAMERIAVAFESIVYC